MLILILIDVQYSQNSVFSFEEFLNRQNHSSGFQHLVKKSPQQCSPLSDTKSGKFLKFQVEKNSNFILKPRQSKLADTSLTKLLGEFIKLHTLLLFFSIQHFEKLGVNLNGLVLKVLDSQSRSLMVKTMGSLQGRLSLSSFRG